MFKKTPFVKQEGIMDCGAASLLMIIKYHKGKISLEKIRELTKTSKTGTNALNIKKAAEEVGFKVKAYKVEAEKLWKIKTPAIAHVIIDGSYRHYVVIYQVKNNKITIADPAKGIKKLTLEEFKMIWNGTILTFELQKQIPKFFENKKITIIQLIKTVKDEIKFIVPLTLLVTLFSIINTYYFKFIIDSLVNKTNKNQLLLVFLIFCLINILNIFTDYFKNRAIINIKHKIAASLSLNVFKQIISLPYKYYCSRNTGEIVSRINDLENVKNMITTVLFVFFLDIPITLITIYFLVLLSKELFFVTSVFYILYFLTMIFYRKKYKKYIKEIQENRAYLNSRLIESISGYETVKGLSIEREIYQKLKSTYTTVLKSLIKFDETYNVQETLKKIISNSSNLIIIFVGSILVLDQKMTIGSLVTYSTLVIYFLEPIKNLLELDINYSEMKSSLKRINNLFYKEKEMGFIKKQASGDIVINNLNYSYNEFEETLKNINLKILKKEKILLYGESGSGKSTLLKLIKKYYDVPRGSIFIGNSDICDYKKDSFNKIAYISQKENLINDTIYNNLTIGSKNKNLTEILKICQIDQFLDKELGLKMIIEENAFNISGGEKQRLVLARTLLKESEIILIDEGFSEMDVNLEKEILKNIFSKYKEKTFIIISHRLDNSSLFDRIIKIKEGKLINAWNIWIWI